MPLFLDAWNFIGPLYYRTYIMFQTSSHALSSTQPPSPPMDNNNTGPEITLMTTGPNGEQKPRKMRASCDACSRAKVCSVLFKNIKFPTDISHR